MSEPNNEDQVLGAETPEADALEQLADVTEAEAGTGPRWPRQVPLDADPADVAEQQREVELDEDDYR